jgi:K+-sensing histidine kinase KdpD
MTHQGRLSLPTTRECSTIVRANNTTGQPLLQSKLAGGAIAIGLVAAAVGLTFSLQRAVSTSGFLFFYAAIVLSAWFGGKWAGAAAVLLGIIAVEYFFLTPLHSFALDRDSLPLFLEFASSSAAVSWFSSWRKHVEGELQRARDELQVTVEDRRAKLRESNNQLKAEIAERRRAEDAYYQAQADLARVARASALGALAASISHEVNQPLAAVVANADACAMWLASDPPDLSEARAAVESIVQDGTRASQILKHTRAMFTNGAPERVRLEINDLIVQVCGLMHGQASRNAVEVVTELVL